MSARTLCAGLLMLLLAVVLAITFGILGGLSTFRAVIRDGVCRALAMACGRE